MDERLIIIKLGGNKKMESLKNDKFILRVLENGSFTVQDIENDILWGSEYPGWVTLKRGKKLDKIKLDCCNVKRQNNLINIKFCNINSTVFGEIDFEMDVELNLQDNCIDLSITKANSSFEIVDIEYPAHLFTVKADEEDDGYVTVPFKQGVIIPNKLEAGFMRYLHNIWKSISDIEEVLPFDSGSLNMPWFGASFAKSSIFAYVKTDADCSLHVIGNSVVSDDGLVVEARQGQNPGKRLSSLGPIWQASRDELGYARKLRIELVSNGYVGMAKKYLEYSRGNGRYVSLKEKIEQNPLVERLIGAPDIKIYIYTNRLNDPYYRSWSEPILNGYSRVHTTFQQVGEIIKDLKNLEIDKSLIILGGWNRAGYDCQHIDMWPPAEPAGGEEGLAQASQVATDAEYIFSLHDNYQDFYLESPSYDERYLMKNKDKSVKLGGVWDGGLCRLICSSQAIELAEPNLTKIMENVKINSYYLDTTTSARLYECYDEDHPLTRKDDRENKLNLLKYLSEQELVVGAEAGIDWAVPVCSYFEGLPGSSKGLFGGIASMGFGIAVPLFNLVYHDAVVCYWQHGQPYGREDHVNHVLHDLLSGQPSSWSLVYDQWEDLKPLIKECYDLLGQLHQKTAHYQLTSHQYLSPDYAVQRSQFDDGTEVTVNFGITSYEYDDGKIAPKGFILKLAGEEVKTGTFSRNIVYK